MKYIIGRKFQMTQEFRENGKVVPVTLVKIQPCTVTAVRSMEKDGYCAVQLSCEPVKRPTKKHTDRTVPRVVKEFRCKEEDVTAVEVGATLDESVFAAGDQVFVRGVSKGRGFQGVVKRHGFHGSPKSHGHKDQLRMPGSIGASSSPSHVFKGKRMGGRMGGEAVTVRGLEVVSIDSTNHVVAIKGAIPGARNSMVTIATQ